MSRCPLISGRLVPELEGALLVAVLEVDDFDWEVDVVVKLEADDFAVVEPARAAKGVALQTAEEMARMVRRENIAREVEKQK